MKRTKNIGNRIPIILLIVIMIMSLSACSARSTNKEIVTTSDIVETETTTEPATAETEPATAETEPTTAETEPTTAETEPTTAETEPTTVETEPFTELTLEDLPPLVPDVLNLRAKEYEDIPFLETQEQLSEYALWNLLYGRTEFECRLSWDLSYNLSAISLERACKEAMAYYLFSSYKPWDMCTVDDGNPDSIYAKVKLVYDEPEYDLEARLAAYNYVMKNPPPEGGFTDYFDEMEYARNVHNYIACKVTYDPMGYDPENMFGATGYDTLQEAYNVLGKNQNTVVCAGYARAFALICQYAGINCAWVWGNQTEISSHAWNVIFPCDGSEPVMVDVTWDDGNSNDVVGQTEVIEYYFYVPLSLEHEHEADEDFWNFIQYVNESVGNGAYFNQNAY